jgi:hypothetical protein
VETVESDDALLEGVRAGTPDWGQIYLAHREAMYHAAAWALEGRSHAGVSAGDVVHKVVIELQRLGLPADARDLGALLVRRTLQRGYDEVRRARRHPTIPLEEDAPDQVNEDADVERIVPGSLWRRSTRCCWRASQWPPRCARREKRHGRLGMRPGSPTLCMPTLERAWSSRTGRTTSIPVLGAEQDDVVVAALAL